jgi:predicted acetyltransferase
VKHPDLTLYDARVDGEVVCVLGTMDHLTDLGFYFVATHPDHRGKGLASRLMSVALVDARERGLETSTLQSSKMGQPVYERLGFETHFRLHMYEHRVPA